MRFNITSPRLAALVCLAMLATSVPTTAQVRRVASSQGGQFMDGLIRDLRNSYLNLSGDSLEKVPPASINSSQAQEIQRALQGYASSATKLITALRFEERYSPSIRLLLADAINVQARSGYLAQQAGRLGSSEQMANEFAELDRAWRLLAHQIQQTPHIGANVTQQVDAINRWNQTLEGLTKVKPQYQQQDLAHHFVIIGGELQHMVEDLQYDLYQHPQQTQLISTTRNLASRAYQLRMAAERDYPYNEIVRYYKEFHDGWLPLKRELRSVNNRYLQRTIDRVSSENDHLHELLLLDPVIDGRDILYMAETLKQNVDTACEGVSMLRLIQIPEAVGIFAEMKEFYTLCQDFTQTVATESDLENVRWDFRELDVSWNDLKTALAPLDSPETTQQVAFIDQYVKRLRDSLGLQPSVDHNQAVQLAASIDNMSDLLTYDINRYVGQNNNYPSQFRNLITGQASTFRSSARGVYDVVARPQDAAVIRQRTQELSDSWHRLEEQIAKVRVQDRGELVKTLQQIAPAITKMQVMYGY